MSASFDCNKASTPTEKAICSNPHLDKMDIALLNAYRYAMNYSGNPTAIKANQKAWINNSLIKCNGNPICIDQAMVSQIKYLSKTVPNKTVISNNTVTFSKVNISSIPLPKGKQFAQAQITQKMLYALSYTLSKNNPNLIKVISKGKNNQIINYLNSNNIQYKIYNLPSDARYVILDIEQGNKQLFKKLADRFNNNTSVRGGIALFTNSGSNNIANDFGIKQQYVNLIEDLKSYMYAYAQTDNMKANSIQAVFDNIYIDYNDKNIMLPEEKSIEVNDEVNNYYGMKTVYTADKDSSTGSYPQYDYTTLAKNYKHKSNYYFYQEFLKNYKLLWNENY
ncbi:MAG: hypothetical protein M0R46_09950 [Candidatus Muirbacterium halophilum]|nr:hypothetical protein [Candidatus Muirbacterium halophilum]